jgi:predicted Zn-dependent peptidase
MKRLLVLLVAALFVLTGAAARVPEPVMRTLPNGLRVAVFVRPGLPIVQAQLQVDGGITAESPGHSGLAFLTAQMLRQGTASRSGDDFATELDTLGGTFAVNVTRDVTQIAMGSGRSEFAALLELMSDAVLNPRFDDGAFQSTRRQIANQLGLQSQNLVAIADDRAFREGFGDHPYAHPLLGGISSLLGATPEQAREFHRDHWRPDHAVLAIAGDIDPEHAFTLAGEWFGRWGGKSAAPPAHGAPAMHKGVLLLDLPGSPLTEVRAVLLGPGRADPDFAGWVLAREALASAALPAGARVTLLTAREACLLMVSTSASPESSVAVAGRIRESLRAFAATPPAGAALETLRRRVAQSWPASVETLGQLLSSWLAGEAAGLPAGHLTAVPQGYRTAALGGVTTALRAGVTLLMTGPADRMKSQLATLGPVELLSPLSEPSLTDPTVTVSPEQRRRGKQLAAATVLAHGGAAKLKGIVNSEHSALLRVNMAGHDIEGETRFVRVDPSRLVFTSRFLDLEHRQVLDGQRGWSLTTMESTDSATIERADSTLLLSFRRVLESDLVHLLRAAGDPASDPVARGSVKLDGKPYDALEFMAPSGGRTRLLLDPTTHRIRTVDALPTPQGAWRERRLWSDYVQVKGVWWPGQEVREQDGEKVSTMILQQIVVNGGVDSSLFRRPIVARGKVRGYE